MQRGGMNQHQLNRGGLTMGDAHLEAAGTTAKSEIRTVGVRGSGAGWAQEVAGGPHPSDADECPVTLTLTCEMVISARVAGRSDLLDRPLILTENFNRPADARVHERSESF